MGVPISFLDKYNPNQFEIVGNEYGLNIPRGRGYVNGKRMFSRIFIKHKVQWSYGSAD
ncbi:restriction endonuclease [Candidatus Saccharibacteria bacterium]|nr:restriction endonuclease [Candidatus Saccharibacteria bacterium]